MFDSGLEPVKRAEFVSSFQLLTWTCCCCCWSWHTQRCTAERDEIWFDFWSFFSTHTAAHTIPLWDISLREDITIFGWSTDDHKADIFWIYVDFCVCVWVLLLKAYNWSSQPSNILFVSQPDSTAHLLLHERRKKREVNWRGRRRNHREIIIQQPSYLSTGDYCLCCLSSVFSEHCGEV